jgi:hypothetical protein
MKSGSASPSYEPARPADAREGVTDWNRDTVRFIPPEPASAGADGIATLLPSGQLSLPDRDSTKDLSSVGGAVSVIGAGVMHPTTPQRHPIAKTASRDRGHLSCV